MLKYRGGKSKEIPRIMWHIPRFSGNYVEPFLGGGALFFYLEPRQSIINDINPKLMSFYRGVRDDFTNLRAELNEIETIYTKNREDFDLLKKQYPDERVDDKNELMYYRLREMFNDLTDKHYSEALLYYYINKTSYSGMIRYNAKGEFNVPFGRYQRLNTSAVTPAHSKLLQRSQIFNTDYSDIFNLCNTEDFVFLDPPYDCLFSDYGNEEYKDGFNETNHRKLANDFMNLPCKALMVIGRTKLTENLYRGYIIDEYSKNYAVNIRNRFKSAANHIVVANYKKCWENASFPNKSLPLYTEAETIDLRLFEAQSHYGTD